MIRLNLLAGLALLLFLPGPLPASDPNAGMTDPSEVGKNPNLNGQQVTLDDRVRYFYESKKGRGLDEVLLRRSDAIFRIPGPLKPDHAPREPVARIVGVVKFEDGRWVVDVTSLDMLPADLARLDAEVKRFLPSDFASRRAWGLWAQKRGKVFNDNALEQKGRELETDALWVEATAPGADPVALARRESARPVSPRTIGALYHTGFRRRLAKARDADELGSIAREVEGALPKAKDARETNVDLGELAKTYESHPGELYREASDAIREGLDRRLLNDARQAWLLRRATDQPGSAIALAEEARNLMPDRPRVMGRLRTDGLDNAEAEVSNLRQGEVEALAKTFREDGDADRARKLLRAWLASRRKNRLSTTDAEGRVLLASQYEKMVGDRDTAADLLREALTIDAENKEAADAFRRMGYRKVEGKWVEPPSGGTTVAEPTRPAQPGPRNAPPGDDDGLGESLRGLTRAQVRSKLGGKPDRTVRVAAQGQTLEQWIYDSPKGTQVVNFLHLPNRPQPLVVSSYMAIKSNR